MSKRTRANYQQVERLQAENEMLRRQIDWLVEEIREFGCHEHGLCPSCVDKDAGCEFTYISGRFDRPDCRACWRENAKRWAEEQ